MSFSSDVKEELSKINNLANKKMVKAELYGYLKSNNTCKEEENIKFSTESEYNINRYGKLLSNMNILDYKIEIVGKKYNITISKKESRYLDEIYNDYQLGDSEEKSFIRGAFLGSGSVNNPKKKYHIEIAVREKNIANYIVEILKRHNIKLKILEGKQKYTIYSKDGEEISKLLAFIEANKSVITFEEIRVYRDMSNNVNRIVNCETANLGKTINASVKQIEAIKKLKQQGKFSSLPDNLKEIANLRLKYPESSLVELGKMLKEPIGKSGVNYRLNAIMKMVD